jgi:hypothetical protein
MSANKKPIRVFYSWQSDLPDSTNRGAIRKALQKAAKELSSHITIDEATRDTAGSVNIPKTILDKIDVSDIFVADVSTIGAADGGRKCPNPNVVFELGYAVATLGWERIVLLFNLAYGELADLPFDFDRHRVSQFTLTEALEQERRKALDRLAKVALDAVITKDPKRPSELKGQSRAQIEHNRDVENLKWVLGTLHLPTIDQQILDLPYYILEPALFHYEDFREIVEDNSLFHLSDKKLFEAIVRFAKAWTEVMSYCEFYRDTPGGRKYVFHAPLDLFVAPEQQQAWNAIKKARVRMRKALDAVLRRVRKDYVEIDLKKTNQKAHSEYLKFQREIKSSRPKNKSGRRTTRPLTH